MEAAQRFLEAKERYPVGSEDWARATAAAFDLLMLKECAEVAKPEWWNDEELKALSARVVRAAAPDDGQANEMRAGVLGGRYLKAKERLPVGSGGWARATARAFDLLRLPECDEVAKPEWWNDEGLKALSARVVRAAPNEEAAIQMRAMVLGGGLCAWKEGSRSAAELKEAATLYERVAAIHPAPVAKAQLFRLADECRSQAGALSV